MSREIMTCHQTASVHCSIVQPAEANASFNLYGGKLLDDIDNNASISAMRLCHCKGATAAIDQMNFIQGFKLGHIVKVFSYVSGVGNRSIEVFSKAVGECLQTGEQYLGATCFLTYVAQPEEEEGFVLPAVQPETDEEKMICAGYDQRRQNQKKQRREDKDLISHISLDFYGL